MSLNKIPFNQIKAEVKTIEARLLDEKRENLKVGESIQFTNTDDQNDKIKVNIKDLSRFNTFTDMFSNLDLSKFGFSAETSVSEAVQIMRQYYSVDEENKYGVLGIHIKLIK